MGTFFKHVGLPRWLTATASSAAHVHAHRRRRGKGDSSLSSRDSGQQHASESQLSLTCTMLTSQPCRCRKTCRVLAMAQVYHRSNVNKARREWRLLAADGRHCSTQTLKGFRAPQGLRWGRPTHINSMVDSRLRPRWLDCRASRTQASVSRQTWAPSATGVFRDAAIGRQSTANPPESRQGAVNSVLRTNVLTRLRIVLGRDRCRSTR